VPEALLGSHLHRRRPRAGHPYRRVRLLQRFGDDVAGRHFDVLTLEPGEGSSVMQRIATSSASSHWARLSAGSMPKPPSSPIDDDSPVPNSTRPSEIRSRVAMRSRPGRDG